MSEVADRESLRARRPSPDLTSVRGCLLSREEQELPSRDGRRWIRRGEPGIRAYCGGSAGGVRRRGRGEARQQGGGLRGEGERRELDAGAPGARERGSYGF